MTESKKFKLFFSVALFLMAVIVTSPSGSNKKYDSIVQTMSSRYQIPAELIHSIIKVESNYESKAVSKKGAMGLMQLMPITAKHYGVANPFDPLQNIEGGVKYLRDLIKLFENKTNLVLAAYNAGQEAVKKYSGIPPYPETRRYIEKVRVSYNKTYIGDASKIYVFRNSQGRAVFTNDYLYYKRSNSRK